MLPNATTTQAMPVHHAKWAIAASVNKQFVRYCYLLYCYTFG